jgi:hypothetical protein
MPRPEDNEDAFLAAVARMPEAFRQCRTGQHKMTEIESLRIVNVEEEGVNPIKGERTYARRTVECDRCGKTRHDYFRVGTRRGHQYCDKIGAYYEKLEGYDIEGLGVIPGGRGLILGMMLDLPTPPVRGRGRPSKGGDAT